MRAPLRITLGLAAMLALSFPASAQDALGRVATGQVSVGTSPIQIVPQRPRANVIVTVTSAVGCSFGNAGVAVGTGFPLQAVAGATLNLDTSAAVYAVCASTATIGFIEDY